MRSIRIPKLKLSPFPLSVCERDCVVVDQTRSKRDYANEAGFIANDIYLINKATTQQEFELLAARLQEIGVKQVDNSKKSDKDLILDIMPAWVQTPSEVARFADYFNAVHPVDKRDLDSDSIPVKDEIPLESAPVEPASSDAE